MQQIHFKVSELVTGLSDKLKDHKLAYKHSYKTLHIDIQFLNLEQGLYFISGKIKLEEDTEFIHIAELTNEWAIIYYLVESINFAQKEIPAGIYLGFDSCNYKTVLEANTELNVCLVIIHREYLKIYNFLSVFDAINNQDDALHYQVFTEQTVLQLTSLKKKMGLIKTKRHVFDLITLFSYREPKLAERLKKDINATCKICMEQRIDISTYLAEKYNLDKNGLNSLFYEIFGISVQYYYCSFQFREVKVFLQEKDSLNELLSINLKSHVPYIKPIIDKFDLDEKTFKQLFLVEVGESINNYYRKIRLNIAKDYLINKKMKVSHVAESLGYKHPTKFIYFIRKYEGYTPRQLYIQLDKSIDLLNF